MSYLPVKQKQINVYRKDGKLWTSSINIAEVFGKGHRSIIQTINKLNISKNFFNENFIKRQLADRQNKHRPYYEVTDKGVVRIVMSLTGNHFDELKEMIADGENVFDAINSIDIGGRRCSTNVYFLKCKETGHIKIGKAIDIDLRVNQLKSLSPIGIDLIRTIKDERGTLESRLHKRFKDSKVPGKKEWFYPHKTVVDYMMSDSTF